LNQILHILGVQELTVGGESDKWNLVPFRLGDQSRETFVERGLGKAADYILESPWEEHRRDSLQLSRSESPVVLVPNFAVAVVAHLAAQIAAQDRVQTQREVPHAKMVSGQHAGEFDTVAPHQGVQAQ
jgi:hypothetical protein